MSRPRVEIRLRSLYAEVVVDLWPCDYDLNEEGARLCRALLEAATASGSPS